MTTLEGAIAERDHLISAIPTELGSLPIRKRRLEALSPELRRHVLHHLPDVKFNRGGDESALVQPPPRPPHLPRLGSRTSFPGGSARASPCTRRPSTSRSVERSAGGEGERTRRWQCKLDDLECPQHQCRAGEPTGEIGAAGERQQGMIDRKGFDSFADINPSTLKTLDAYRIQLWGIWPRSSTQWQGFAQQQQQSGPRGELRPHYLASKVGKGATASMSPNSSSAPSGKDTVPPLWFAFWEAFSGLFWFQFDVSWQGKGKCDPEKVRKVLEGTAVVRVVDVDPVPTAVSATVDVKPIVGAVAKPHVVPNANPMSSANPGVCEVKTAGGACALLEESMRS
ncbi:hypothetical protein BV22DRAFT_1134245 [Leucogyrophana mollusca]|uniref:Uncharacterized protein n=1 Tax=Leucogyrophana mollusca TaxID=85980 RepID=A0ACB8AZR1_9AGAM|nr:hypothetical protein BV22DRAFT_1134245 [Leucogyrophana mollusca]